MNILFLTWKDVRHPHAGGAERVMLEYAKWLVSRGHEVTWFASSFPGGEDEAIIDGIKIIRRYTQHTIWMGAWWWYRTYKKDHPIDIIIDEAGGWPLLSPLYEKDTPLFFFIHHIPEKEFDIVPFPFSWVIRWMYHMMIRCYRNTPTITVSSSTRDELIHDFRFHPSSIFIIENTTEIIPLESIDFDTRVHDIVFLGRLTPIKRPDHAIWAFVHALRDIPGDARLHIIGNPQDKKYVSSLHALVENLDIEDRVVFHGFLDTPEYQSLLWDARLMLVPSEKEGYGLVVIEGNAYGLPVIAYDVPWLRDSVKSHENGILIPDGDIAAMSRGIVEMFANEEAYRILARKSLSHVRSIPKWKDQVEKLEKIILEKL